MNTCKQEYNGLVYVESNHYNSRKWSLYVKNEEFTCGRFEDAELSWVLEEKQMGEGTKLNFLLECGKIQ